MQNGYQLEVISTESAAQQLGLELHTITFSDQVPIAPSLSSNENGVDWQRLAKVLNRFDAHLQVKQVSSLFGIYSVHWSGAGWHRLVRRRVVAGGSRRQPIRGGADLGRVPRVVGVENRRCDRPSSEGA